MKTLLKVKGSSGLFLWLDGSVAKLVVATTLANAKPGTVYPEEVNAWERGTYIHYWDYGNDTLSEAINLLETRY